MLYLLSLVLCQVFLPSFSQIRDHSDDFYWRDYNGIVPKDALPGGLDSDHKPTYIGQAIQGDYYSHYSTSSMVPGHIFPGVMKMYYVGEYSAFVEVEHIKILCTKNPDNFEWIKTHSNAPHLLRIPTLIPGGFVSGDVLYIGRGIAGNVLAVGRVMINQGTATAKFKTNVNGNLYIAEEFEVLSYRMRNPDYYASGAKMLSGTVYLIILLMTLRFVNLLKSIVICTDC